MDNKDKVRIINDKGEVKHVSPKIAGNAKLLKSYGFRVEDFKKEEKVAEMPIGETIPSQDEILRADLRIDAQGFEPETIVEKSLEELKEEYFELTGKKAGNKKADTIKAEIEEYKTGLNK